MAAWHACQPNQLDTKVQFAPSRFPGIVVDVPSDRHGDKYKRTNMLAIKP